MESGRDSLLELAWKRTEECMEEKKVLDSKASILLTANGIILGFIATAWTNLNHNIAPFAIFTAIISIAFCICVLWIRYYARWKLRETRSNVSSIIEDANKIRDYIYTGLAEMEEINRPNNVKMVLFYQIAVVFFIISVGLMAVSLFLSS